MSDVTHIAPPEEAKRFPALSSPATLRELIADGVYLDLPMEHYIDDPAISGSGLKKLLVSPTDFKWELPKRNPLFTPSESDARLLGTLVHCAVLEGMGAFDDRYFVAPEFDDNDPRVIRTADHAKTWLADRGEKKTGLKAELFERVKACADLMKLEGAAEDELPVFLDDAIAALAAMGNGRRIKIKQRDHDYVAQVCAVVRAWPDVAALFAAGAGLPEVSVFWTDNGVRYKARLDWLSAAAVVDIKKFGKMPPRGTSLEGFLQQEAMFYCYDTQAVHNRRAAMQIPLLLKAGLCSASGEGARARLDLLTAISDAIVREPPIFHWLWLRTPGPPQGLLMDFHHETKRWEHCEFEIDQVALENLQRYRKTCGHELEQDRPWVQVGRASWDDDEVREHQWNLSR
jgi:hypothetical protein